MVVDRTPGETGEMNGNVASRPDMPDSEAVDESTPFLKESYREQLIAQVRRKEAISRSVLTVINSNGSN